MTAFIFEFPSVQKPCTPVSKIKISNREDREYEYINEERRRYYPGFSRFQAAGKTDRVSGGIDTK